VILDVGCGERKRGHIGVDNRKLVGVDVLCDASCLPFPPETFDVVRSHVVIEHVLDPLLFIKEQIRVLKTRGLLLCEADNARYWRYHIDFSPFEEDFVHHFKTQNYDSSAEHLRIYYPECIRKLFEFVGLTNVRWSYKSSSKALDRILGFFLPRLRKNNCPRFTVAGYKS
jgi:ubiquinone/menaquinone biosynthesis C-methylase UbiE